MVTTISALRNSTLDTLTSRPEWQRALAEKEMVR